MVLFIFFIILAVIALVLGGVAVAMSGEDRQIAGGISGVVVVLSLICLFFSSFVSIGTKNLGVETVGGKPSGYLTNGYHFKKPWAHVTELTNAVQTDTYASDGGASGKQQGGAAGTCINVRIEGQSTACVNVSIRWQAKPAAIDYLFRNFKNNDAITDNLVLRDLQQAINEEFVNYNPLGIDSNGVSTNRPLSSSSTTDNFSAIVTADMQKDIGQYIDVQSVIIPLINFDGPTQAKIQSLQQQVTATRIAQAQKLTNEAQSEANKALSASLSNDPGVLESKCLDIVKDAVDNGKALPAGFTCLGGNLAVTVPTK